MTQAVRNVLKAHRKRDKRQICRGATQGKTTDMKAEVGVFPTLTLPARKLARELKPGEVAELSEYPGFWVCHFQDLPDDAYVVLKFRTDDTEFALFELL